MSAPGEPVPDGPVPDGPVTDVPTLAMPAFSRLKLGFNPGVCMLVREYGVAI